MAPPKFKDIGRVVKDLFSDNYNFGETKLTLKSKTQSGVNLKVDGSRLDSGVVSGSLETKYSHPSGISIKEKWNTKNVVSTEITIDNQPIDKAKVTLESAFSPNSGFSSLALSAETVQDLFTVDGTFTQNNATVSAVGAYSNFLLGASAKYDIKKTALADYKVTGSYVDKDFRIVSSVTNGKVVEGGVYHTPTSSIAAGVQFSWNQGSNDTTFEVGSLYKLDAFTTLKAKIDKNLQIGGSYTQELRPGISMTLSALINGQNLTAEGHSLGLALSFEA